MERNQAGRFKSTLVIISRIQQMKRGT